ncbi:unnamed protein product [Didymodactylos carnosus]|uniref:ADP ribosyltransferase domain-containing protein n=1 Tax=Didymodactylos carnosus TaxID=1234261 RepID=A0A814P3B4_9BILA|nr:unnamed protein product [Didymodactylos carnosus]CAF3867060.1 unnamed protein product [Didymodactylos carnosus]
MGNSMGDKPSRHSSFHDADTYTNRGKITIATLTPKETVLIWFDENMDSEPVETKRTLSQITDQVVFYTSQKLFLDYTRSIPNQTKSIVLIVSGACARDILKECHSLQHINSVYIYCMIRDRYISLMAEYNKVKGIHNELEDLKISLIEEITRSIIARPMIVQSTVAQSTIAPSSFYTLKQNYNRNLTRESASFIWFQLLRNILFKMPTKIYRTNEAKQALLTRCRSYFATDEAQLKNINEFEEKYRPENAIREYTKEGFLYKIINQALRTEDVQLLYAFRYYIVDLWLSLVELSNIFKTSSRATTAADQTILVYRGLISTKDELDKLKINLKDSDLLAPNGFISTSLRRDVAETFADINNERQNDTKVKIIHEIKINLRLKSIVLADISGLSAIDNEAEILIGVGATFKLDEIEERKNDNGTDIYWLIKMHATDEGEHIAQEYIDYERKESCGNNETIVFGRLLINMGEYRKAIDYFITLLPSSNRKSVNNDNNDKMFEDLFPSSSEEENNQRAIIYFSLGDAYVSVGDVDRALRYLEESRLYYDLLNNNYVRSASAYISQQQYDLARDNYTQAIELYRQLEHQELNIACCLNGLGDVYADSSTKDYGKAANYYKEAYDIRKKLLTDLHPEIAMSFYNMGRLCYLRGDDNHAAKYLYEALKRKEKIFLPYHQSIACNLHCMGKVYHRQGDYIRASTCLYRALECYTQTLGSNHPDVLNLGNDIGKVISAANRKIKKT